MVCDGPYIPAQTFLEILHQTSIWMEKRTFPAIYILDRHLYIIDVYFPYGRPAVHYIKRCTNAYLARIFHLYRQKQFKSRRPNRDTLQTSSLSYRSGIDSRKIYSTSIVDHCPISFIIFRSHCRGPVCVGANIFYHKRRNIQPGNTFAGLLLYVEKQQFYHDILCYLRT